MQYRKKPSIVEAVQDMNGRDIEINHIVAVRYGWNSYVGVVKLTGLCAVSPAKRFAFNSPHSIDASATYQILGHTKSNHKDFNQAVYDWYVSGTGECPIKITVYENIETL